jgi:c-di-GMP-binding flagellar brake protein YcgR
MASVPADSGKRLDTRLLVCPEGETFVELTLSDGSNWCCDLLNISEGGLCFGLMEEQPELTRGQRLDGAMVQIEELEIEGSLVIAHTTEVPSGRICGAKFVPASVADERKLRQAIAELGKREQQEPKFAPVG